MGNGSDKMIDVKGKSWEKDFGPIKVDKCLILRQANRYTMGSVRISLGRIITDEDLAASRAKAPNLKPP